MNENNSVIEKASKIWPAVSCMCLTYGRPNLLEEAIQSFLQQDYPGQKELVVLNDLKQQTLIFDHPEVRIVNLPERVMPLGTKRNVCAQEARYDVLLPWDDDDIYLSNRIRYSVQILLSSGARFFKPDRAYCWNNNKVDDLCGNTFHAQSCFTRTLFDAVGGYTEMGSGQDQDIEKKFLIEGECLFFATTLAHYFYLYRWGGIEYYHLSAFGKDSNKKPITGEQKIGEIIETAILDGHIQTGEITLNPHWNADYQQQVDSFNQSSTSKKI